MQACHFDRSVAIILIAKWHSVLKIIWRGRSHDSQGLTVREIVVRLKVDKTALYDAWR